MSACEYETKILRSGADFVAIFGMVPMQRAAWRCVLPVAVWLVETHHTQHRTVDHLLISVKTLDVGAAARCLADAPPRKALRPATRRVCGLRANVDPGLRQDDRSWRDGPLRRDGGLWRDGHSRPDGGLWRDGRVRRDGGRLRDGEFCWHHNPRRNGALPLRGSRAALHRKMARPLQASTGHSRLHLARSVVAAIAPNISAPPQNTPTAGNSP